MEFIYVSVEHIRTFWGCNSLWKAENEHFLQKFPSKKLSSPGTLNINISKSDTLMYNLTSLKISDEGYDFYYALNPKGP